MATYTGYLASKKKDDLLSIHTALSLPPLTGRVTKYDLAEQIRSELKSNPAARQDERFAGLWEHMPESRMDDDELERHVGSGEAVDLGPGIGRREGSVASAGSANAAGGGRTSPRKSIGEMYHPAPAQEQGADLLPSTYRDTILEGAPHILDALLHSPSRNHSSSDELGLALVPASRATRSLRRRASMHVREAAKTGVELVGETQERLSSAWVVVVGIVAAELAWVVYEAVPYFDYTFGPHPYLLLPFPALHYTLRLPALSVLLHPTFLSALSLWSLTTLALPLLLATLVPFSQSSSRKSTVGRGGRSKTAIAPPNVFIFSLTRLALALLRGYILPSPSSLPTSTSSAGHTVVATLKHALHELVHPSAAHGGAGLSGGRYAFEGAVEGYWGVMALGMAVGVAVAGYEGV
ncbi:hypothetical protein JCM6882_008613 [Rhodosporidiobolus microsporus]